MVTRGTKCWDTGTFLLHHRLHATAGKASKHPETAALPQKGTVS